MVYSLPKIKKYWLVNKWVISFLYALIFSIWVLNTSSAPVMTRVAILILNILVVKGLIVISEKLIKQVYKPAFYQKGKMTLLDVIRRQTTPWSKVYKDEDDYNKRKEFDIGIRSIWLTLLLTVILIFVFDSFLIISTGRNNFFIVNWSRAASVFFLMAAYSNILIFIEGMEFEKARFGQANIKQLIKDYIPLIVILLIAALWFAIK